MTLFTSVLVFIFGTIIGSFSSVVIFRTHNHKKGIILSRSACTNCNKKLKWHHLIPVFSYIFLRGKCAYCGKKISAHYLALELIMGLSFLAVFLTFNFIQAIPSTINNTIFSHVIDWEMAKTTLFYALQATFLIIIFFYDLLYKEIPDRFSLPAIAIAIAGGLIFKTVEPQNMLIGGLGIALFFTAQFVLSKGRWIGGGDIRLGALMGILLGWKLGVLALVIAYIFGSLISIILIIQRKATRKSEIPFGPFLVTGTITAIFFGERILDWYLNTLLW